MKVKNPETRQVIYAPKKIFLRNGKCPAFRLGFRKLSKKLVFQVRGIFETGLRGVNIRHQVCGTQDRIA
jgi:hypothetical protein